MSAHIMSIMSTCDVAKCKNEELHLEIYFSLGFLLFKKKLASGATQEKTINFSRQFLGVCQNLILLLKYMTYDSSKVITSTEVTLCRQKLTTIFSQIQYIIISTNGDRYCCFCCCSSITMNALVSLYSSICSNHMCTLHHILRAV